MDERTEKAIRMEQARKAVQSFNRQTEELRVKLLLIEGLPDTCGGTGWLECECGGDQCVCSLNGGMQCLGCEDCENQDFYEEDGYE